MCACLIGLAQDAVMPGRRTENQVNVNELRLCLVCEVTENFRISAFLMGKYLDLE